MKFFASILLILIPFFNLNSQDETDTILNFTLSYRGLTKDDITIPVNFDKDKSPRNDARLLLPVVKELMINPLNSPAFIDKISGWSNLSPDSIIMKMFEEINYKKESNADYEQNNSEINLVNVNDFDGLGAALIRFIKNQNKLSAQLTSVFSNDELQFVNQKLMSLISETDNDNGANSDIFKFNEARDSSLLVSKKTLDILSKTDRKKICSNSIRNFAACFLLFNKLSSQSQKYFDNKFELHNQNVSGKFFYYSDEGGIRIAIGGSGKNIYTGHFDFIIDYGGDDVYSIDKNKSSEKNRALSQKNFSCIIDLGGNDYYSSDSDKSLGASVFSSGFIFDKSGDDTYRGKNISLGSAVCGLGVLYDENGNDNYHSDQFSIGASSFGAGLLFDKSGNDLYVSNSYSQGFGMTEGIGALIDNSGNDNYVIDARSLDIGRYEDHFISMSQGYGLGFRPYYAGGIGLIIEGGGNDFYATDIFGQGGAYWYGIGCIAEKSGHDKYNSYQYAQGAGIHLAVGLLKDSDGWDFYTSDGVSQGCGHDFGFGLLIDERGNDNYSAYSLSQGAGNANGIGMLVDKSGRDGYLNKEPGNSRGYGNSRREYGSLGIFLDESGEDFYSAAGRDSVISNSSMWGVTDDFYLQDVKAQFSGNTFKIPADTTKKYSLDEYFVMAKTLEPRFSLWQEYGFRKLAEDSSAVADFILKFLDTDDHRAALVLRNLAMRLNYTFGNFFTEQLLLYNKSMRAKPVFNQNEVSFICYLFGETRNPAGKNELLQLTYDDNVRIRTSALNALGKIPADTSDIEFSSDISARLTELANENSSYKLYSKDIAYAFGNYKIRRNIPSLIDLMNYNYFGVRFLAADDLKKYGDDYFEFLTEETLIKITKDRRWFQAFLNSISNLTENNFMNLFERISRFEISNDEIIKLNYIELLKSKSQLSQSTIFKEWSERLIKEFSKGNLLKVN